MKKVLVGFLVFSIFISPSFASAMSVAGPELSVQAQISAMSDLIQRIQNRLNELKVEGAIKPVPVIAVENSDDSKVVAKSDVSVDKSVKVVTPVITPLGTDYVSPAKETSPQSIVTATDSLPQESANDLFASINTFYPNFGERFLAGSSSVIAWNYKSPLVYEGEFGIKIQSANDSSIEEDIHSCGSGQANQKFTPYGNYFWLGWDVGYNTSGQKLNITDGKYKVLVYRCDAPQINDLSDIPFDIVSD